MSNQDRRQQPRVEWAGEALAAFGSREVRLHTRDLSIGGCCVETPWCPTLGERVGLVLHVDGAPVGAWAEVAWASPTSVGANATYAWGLRFLELEDSCRARLEAYLDHCLAVDMLDEMLRGAPNAPVAGFTAGEFDEVPTRIFSHVSDHAGFFPSTAGAVDHGEATLEIEIESTLTSEVPRSETVRVDIASLYAQAAHAGALHEEALVAAGWDLAGPEPIGMDAFGWNVSATGVERPSSDPFSPSDDLPLALGDPGDVFGAPPAGFPGHAEAPWSTTPSGPSTPQYAAAQHDPNLYAKVEPFETHAAPAHPAPAPPRYDVVTAPPYDPSASYPQATASYQPGPYDPGAYDPSAYTPAAYDPNTYDPSAYDPSAFDPSAFAPAAHDPSAVAPAAHDPSAFAPAALAAAPAGPAQTFVPVPAPAVTPRQAVTVETAPLSAKDLLELKRKRIDELLSSVPRREAPPTSADAGANAGKTTAPGDKGKVRARPADQADTGLRRLFNQAIRDVTGDD